jgi:hypothetical protein
MAITQFPEPADLQVDFINRTGDSRPVNVHPWGVENPHPGFGKDPNIANEYGHTKYPMFVGSVIAHNPEEEKAARGEAEVLRDDGPTIEEYVAKGYKASTYPPKGFASKSSEEDVKKAVATEAWTKK